jgi:hypothetical protein
MEAPERTTLNKTQLVTGLNRLWLYRTKSVDPGVAAHTKVLATVSPAAAHGGNDHSAAPPRRARSLLNQRGGACCLGIGVVLPTRVPARWWT